MAFAKSFMFSLIAFIGLNVVFLLLAYLVSGHFDLFMASFQTDFLGTLNMLLFGPIASPIGSPGLIFVVIGTAIAMGGTIPTFQIILYIGYFVAPIIGAFLSGFFAENRKEAFSGWFLTAMICTILAIVLGIMAVLSVITPTTEYIIGNIVIYLGVGLTVGLFYGCIALLSRRD